MIFYCLWLRMLSKAHITTTNFASSLFLIPKKTLLQWKRTTPLSFHNTHAPPTRSLFVEYSIPTIHITQSGSCWIHLCCVEGCVDISALDYSSSTTCKPLIFLLISFLDQFQSIVASCFEYHLISSFPEIPKDPRPYLFVFIRTRIERKFMFKKT